MAPRPDDWPRVREVFEAALALPVDVRRSYVAKACDGDASLRQQVELLLDSHERANSFLETPAAPPVGDTKITTHLEGKRIGPYLLGTRIGAGGMGEVYKARDTRLDRTVAIKVLPAHVAQDPQARERFEREARAVAALNHPHICTLHDVGHHDGIDYLVMEHLEGETLAARLAKGALPLADAQRYAIEVASALDKAHRAGIVHRDLKPGNIFLVRNGGASAPPTAKLLDFGLAKACAPAVAMGVTRATAASELTTPGTILGTVQYMAPEQIEGKDADARTDIFAFGAVLFEMLTGRKAFEGTTAASLIAAVLEHSPPAVSTLQPLVPPALDRIVSTCVAKDPDDRWQSARDLRRELQWAADAGVVAARDVAPASARGARRTAVGALVAAMAIAAALWAATVWRGKAPAQMRDVRFSIYPERGSAFSPSAGSIPAPQFALSADGSRLAYVATSGGRAMLWVRPLNALNAFVLPGTEEATYPFWSEDSRFLGFVAQGKLKSVSIAGGAPVVRADASFDSRGGAWAADGTILTNLVVSGPLWQVSPDATVRKIGQADGAEGADSQRWPAFLPDGRHFLFTARTADISRRGVYLAAIGETARTRLVDGDWGAAAVDGRLLFIRGRALMAQSLDVDNRRVTGEPVVVLDDVAATGTGYPGFAISRSGTLVYSEPWPLRGALVWFSRDGRPVGEPIAPPADYVDFALSPDAARLAISKVDPQTNASDIWILDLGRGSMTRLTSDPMTDASPVWSPDGSRIVFRSNRRGSTNIWIKPVNGNRDEEVLFDQGNEGNVSTLAPSDYARSGAYVLVTGNGLRTQYDVWALSIGPPMWMTPLVHTPFNEYHGVLSPDGRWLAYVSDETGAPQVYVQSFPKGNLRFQVSSQGASEPQWRRDGGELYFLSEDRMLMAASVSLQPTFSAGLPTPLFRTRVPLTASAYRRNYLPAPDGQRFLVNTTLENQPTPAVQVVLDWHALIDARRK